MSIAWIVAGLLAFVAAVLWGIYQKALSEAATLRSVLLMMAVNKPMFVAFQEQVVSFARSSKTQEPGVLAAAASLQVFGIVQGMSNAMLSDDLDRRLQAIRLRAETDISN